MSIFDEHGSGGGGGWSVICHRLSLVRVSGEERSLD